MRMITVSFAVLALALSSPFAFAHKHKGWGCHKHPQPKGHDEHGFGVQKKSLTELIHCGNGSR